MRLASGARQAAGVRVFEQPPRSRPYAMVSYNGEGRGGEASAKSAKPIASPHILHEIPSHQKPPIPARSRMQDQIIDQPDVAEAYGQTGKRGVLDGRAFLQGAGIGNTDVIHLGQGFFCQ